MSKDIDSPIYVTRPFLPPREEFDSEVDKIWQSGQLTNRGPLLQDFEDKIRSYLNVDHFQFVSNGTMALQLAIHGLDIDKGEIITTPFSYVATISSILWQHCVPVFVDIDKESLNINSSLIESAITPRTKAILAVHVFGNACDVDKIQSIADKHSIKVIYDAAHAFGATYHGKSLLGFGDVSTVSFHATKLFHTVEGGGIIARDQVVDSRIDLSKRFGHNGDVHIALGINAKASEIHAAMGLSNLKYVSEIINDRKRAYKRYDNLLRDDVTISHQLIADMDGYNYAYYPIIMESEEKAQEAIERCNKENIFPRRYFYPSLNTISYIENKTSCPISEDISRRVLCLPIYMSIEDDIIQRVVGCIKA